MKELESYENTFRETLGEDAFAIIQDYAVVVAGLRLRDQLIEWYDACTENKIDVVPVVDFLLVAGEINDEAKEKGWI